MLTKNKSFYIRFFLLLLPITLQNIIVYSVNMADNVMLGMFSEDALSGVALGNQVHFVLQMLSMGVTEGVLVMNAQYWGKRDIRSLESITGLGVKLQILLSALFFVLVMPLAPQLLGLMTDSQPVIDAGTVYLRIMCFSYVFFCLTNGLVATMRSVETVKIGVAVNLTALVVNIFLNYVLIFGHFGAPRLGVAGGAIATVISRITEFIVILVYVLVFDKKLQLKVKTLLKWDMSFLKDYIRYGMPMVISGLLWSLGAFVQMGILGRLGQSAISASSIANTLFQIVSVAAYASAGAASVMTGKAIGAGEYNLVKQYARAMQFIFLCLGLISGTALWFLRDFVIGFYNVSDASKIMAGNFLKVLSVTLVGTAYQMPCLTGIVRGGGDTKFVLFNDMIFVWLVVVPLSILAAFVFRWEPVYVFMCLKCDQILKCFVAVVKVNRFRWIKNLTR